MIPGARNVEQARSNAEAGALPALSDAFTAGVRDLYDTWFRPAIHDRW